MEQQTASMAFSEILRRRATEVEARLAAVLSPPAAGETADAAADGRAAWPPHLRRAMRDGVLNGGKRLRPLLLLESAALCAAAEPQAQRRQMRAALECAAALECVHCYSLIHDDLPAFDNDDWRRGRPAVHKTYGEAAAILAGNALLTLAFQLLTAPENGLMAAEQAALAGRLAAAAGAGGMIGGQMLDMLAENRPQTAADITRLEMMKTGALLHFACIAGAILTQSAAENTEILSKFGASIGFAYQLADDILDTEGSSKDLGKTLGKDAAAGKATLPRLYGLDKSKILLREKVEEAQDSLAPFGAKADILRQAARFIACRRS